MADAPRSREPVRVVVLCCDGPWQRVLVAAVARRYELAGIVFVHFTPRSAGTNRWRRAWRRYSRYLDPRTLVRHLRARGLLRRSEEAAEPLVRELSRVGGEPARVPEHVPVLHVPDVNDARAVAFVEERAPDVVCVNGTNLLRAPMLDLIPRIPHGIVNLHTGLSPYSRGGNCNLFMLLEGRPERVGVTIHHIDRGIDSGDIIRTARPRLEPDDTFETIHAKAFRLGIDLMVEAVAELVEGRARRVKQWTEGKLFLRRTGYRYSPWMRVRVNRRLENGLIADYLADRERRDRGIRLVGPDDPDDESPDR